MCVGRQERTIDMKLEKLLVLASNRGWDSRRDNCRPQGCGRFDWLCPTPQGELVIDVLGGERMKGKAWIAPEICTLGRSTKDVSPKSTLGHDRTERMYTRPPISSYCREVTKRRSVLVEERSTLAGQFRSS
jgi:hypothetical protein